MFQIAIIMLAVLLTFSYGMIKGIVTKISIIPGNTDGKYTIYIWGTMVFATTFFIKDKLVYQLPVVDKRMIYVFFTIFIANMFIAKYAGYKPIGRFNIINFVIFYPIVEEVIFRGYILPLLNKSFQYTFIEIAYLPVSISVIISAFLFSIAHLQYYKLNKWSIRYMSFAFIGGILFGAIANYTQSILIPLLLHIEFNFLAAYYSSNYQKVSMQEK
ncbi:CPBP family intramembrane glutamic endopeptidase [Psychrobacillus sp.]|uniref:CPBP family intramembrane glutamic endopeptidase n=1 Tax=Psychrobacillus sp. TaxID=1871623 RepID=UPI0028BD39DB|nr:CPBP family intramembrane glutamic endopeptidase [Psychrobacillus sp.]